MNTKENEDSKDILMAVSGILRTWCDNCRYKQSEKEASQHQQSNEFQEDTEDSTPEYCYFIKMKVYVKVGKSKNPIKRHEQISRNSPFKTKLLHCTALVDEPMVHKRFLATNDK